MCQPTLILVALLLHQPPDNELKQLQGTWRLLGYSVDGRLIRGQDAQCALVIEDDRWTLTWRKDGGGEQVEQGVVKIVDSRGQPKIMDLFHDHGAYKGTTTRALYQIQSDVLRYSALVMPAGVEDSQVQAATLTWKRKR
jgi:uncharacterized protein (TIGR03067 family)